jgi:hypothetical protein
LASSLVITVPFNQLLLLIPGMYAEADKRLFTLGEAVRDAAHAMAPYQTGALAEGIYVTAPGQSTYGEAAGTAESLRPGHVIGEGDIGPHEAIIGPSVDYGIEIEYGSIHNPAEPYMVPAAEAVRPTAGEYFKDLL